MKHPSLLCILLASLAFFAPAWAVKDGDRLTLDGVIRLVGNMPFTRLVLTSGNRDYYLLAPKERLQTLQGLQGRRVKLTGRLQIKHLHFPNPKYDFDRYSLQFETLKLLPAASR